jgi:hypothetical protein
MNSDKLGRSLSSWRFISVANGPGQIVLAVTPPPPTQRQHLGEIHHAGLRRHGARPGNAITDSIGPVL